MASMKATFSILAFSLALVGASAGAAEAERSEKDFLSRVRRLTFEGRRAGEGYFSSDGRKMVFQSERETDNPFYQIYELDLTTGETRRVSPGQGKTTCGYYLDGDRRIFYASSYLADSTCPPMPDMSQGYVWALDDYDIFVANADGSEATRLTTTPGYDAEGTLSPDGRTIAFTSIRDGDLDIYTMHVDGSNVRRLTTELGYDGGPFWSHDGTRIVYRAFHPESPEEQAEYRGLLARHLVRPLRMELWVMNADGTGRHQITQLGGANFAPYFTPDDRRIIFSSNHTNPHSRNFDLYLVNLDGSGLEQVTTHPDFDGFPMFSPDGRRLVWASNRHGQVRGETNIFIADWRP